MDIFDQYFYDLTTANALKDRGEKTGTPSPSANEPDFSDIIGIIRAKLKIFAGPDTSLIAPNASGTTGYVMPPHAVDLYRTGRIFYTGASGGRRIQLRRVEFEQLQNIKDLYDARIASPYHAAFTETVERYYTENADGSFSLYLQSSATTPVTAANQISCETVKKPDTVVWGYVVVNEKALYDSNSTTDFELHDSEETNLVIKILELAGITINKPGLVQIASNEEKQNIEQTQ